MAPRTIIRDPAILGGRWHFADTAIAVAEVRLDHADYTGVADAYQYGTLSAEEISAALGFVFPVIRSVGLSMIYAGFTLECECGEDTHWTLTGDPSIEIPCVCGRLWRVDLQATEVRERAALSGLTTGNRKRSLSGGAR